MLLHEHGANGRRLGANESLLSSQRIREQLALKGWGIDGLHLLTSLTVEKDHRWRMAWEMLQFGEKKDSKSDQILQIFTVMFIFVCILYNIYQY